MVPKWPKILPQALILPKSQPPGLQQLDIDYQYSSKTPFLVLTGNPSPLTSERISFTGVHQMNAPLTILKNLPARQETWVWFLRWEDTLDKEMATHSSILAWRILWTEEPGRLQSIGSQRVGLDWVSDTLTFFRGPWWVLVYVHLDQISSMPGKNAIKRYFRVWKV